MKILGICDGFSGCSYHRVSNPLKYMGGTRYVTDIPKPEVLNHGWDIITFNRVSVIDGNFDEIRKITGAKIVVDFDDDWVLPPSHLNYDQYVEIRDRLEKNIREADAVTVTHERLAERIREYNENVFIIPNAIPFGDEQFADEKIPSDKLRLFWAGGISHVNDLEMLRQPMKRISTLPVQTVIGGYTNTNDVSKILWDKMVSAFTCGMKIPGMVLTSLPVNEYMNHLCHADVMLVPLEKSYWHGMKSNLKLLEAAAKKIPVIVSKVDPYLDGKPPVFHVERQKDWFEYVNLFVNNPGMVELWGQKLYEWAQQFSMENVTKIRTECYSSLLK